MIRTHRLELIVGVRGVRGVMRKTVMRGRVIRCLRFWIAPQPGRCGTAPPGMLCRSSTDVL